jgi:hypothetical protein
MHTIRMTWKEHLLTAVLFGSIALYCIHGALMGDLYIPNRHSEGVHLYGMSAWLITGSPIAFYLALLIRAGFVSIRSGGLQFFVELLLLIAGISLIIGSVHLQRNSKVTASMLKLFPSFVDQRT